MKPVSGEARHARSTLALSDFIGVMDIDMVDSAAVDVQLPAQEFEAHRRTFQMPAGKTDTPRRVPFHLALGAFW